MITFNNKQIEVIEKITKLSKMYWLWIDENGRCRDIDNHNRIISPKRVIKDIIEGVSLDTLERLTHKEFGIFLSIISKVLY